MKILKNKKMDSRETDDHELRLLRQMLVINEQLKVYGDITEEEYRQTLNYITCRLDDLEGKYDGKYTD